MEIGIEDEIVDMSMVPPSSIVRNDFGHNKEFMSKDAYLRNRCSEIDIEVEDSSFNQNGPLPIFLKVLGTK
jgi:hypothetical protein